VGFCGEGDGERALLPGVKVGEKEELVVAAVVVEVVELVGQGGGVIRRLD
jgi:hypothetical protein